MVVQLRRCCSISATGIQWHRKLQWQHVLYSNFLWLVYSLYYYYFNRRIKLWWLIPGWIKRNGISFFFFKVVLCKLWDLSSPILDPAHASCSGMQSPNHWTTREFPEMSYFDKMTRYLIKSLSRANWKPFPSLIVYYGF